MRAIKNFAEFVRNGTVKKQAPDVSRAEFLRKESEKSKEFLDKLIKEFSITDENANSIIKLCYDIIMELIRAKMLTQGFNASGHGAHEAEISYLKELKISEKEIIFADELRYYRNGIVYYGKILDKEYAEKVVNFLNKMYAQLTK